MSDSNIASDPLSAFPLDRRTFIAALAAAGLAGCRKSSAASVRIINGSGAGSASDNMLRLMARHFARLGVDATIENVPRGSGKLATKQLNGAARDGSVIGLLPTGLLYAQLMREDGMNADLTSFEWLGSAAIDRRVLVVTGRAGVGSFKDLIVRGRPLICPAGSHSGPARFETQIVTHLTGAPFKVVPGYVGGARLMSMISGETEGTIGSLDSLGSVLELKGSHVLLRLNEFSPPAQAPADVMKAPLLRDFAHGPDTAPLLALVSAHARLGRIFALPPGTPAGIVAQWRGLLATVISDPAFRKEAAALNFETEFTDGPTVAAQLKDILDIRRDQVEAALRRAIEA